MSAGGPPDGLPDRQYLLQAFRRIRIDSWGNDLDAALSHPIRGKMIVSYARRLALHPSPPPAPNPPKLPGKIILPSTPLPLDRKRLASGEKDDDD